MIAHLWWGHLLIVFLYIGLVVSVLQSLAEGLNIVADRSIDFLSCDILFLTCSCWKGTSVRVKIDIRDIISWQSIFPGLAVFGGVWMWEGLPDLMIFWLQMLYSWVLVLAGDECERAKPDPMPYLMAMERLGLTPETTVCCVCHPSVSSSDFFAPLVTLRLIYIERSDALPHGQGTL